MTALFMVSWFREYLPNTRLPYYFWGNWVIAGLYFVIFLLCAHVYDTFKISINRISDMIFSAALSAFLSDAILFIVVLLLTAHLKTPVPLARSFFFQIVIAILWAYLAKLWFFSTYSAKKTLIIWDLRQDFEELIREYRLDRRYDVQATLRVETVLANPRRYLKNIETVFFSGVHSKDRNHILKYCINAGIDAYVIPRVGDLLMSSAKRVHMCHLPMMKVERYNPSPEYLFVKRLLDIVLSAIGIVVLSPLLIITAIAIKANDGGKVFYKQCRLTKDGKRFNVLKFRSMRMDAEKDGVARLSTGDSDDRVTSVGRVIRRTRIDELPQLFNILRGDMTIVGPRPERPEIAAQYEEDMPEFALRLQAKAGLTGYAQVYGKYNTTPYDKLLLDLMYISSPSIVEDLKICLGTFKILFTPDSTEGVAEGQTTAADNGSSEKKHDK